MKRFLKEPLLHFLIIGLGLFLVYGLTNKTENKKEIVIDNYLINELTAKWALKRNRPPNLQELKGMVDEYVEQEVLYREALAMNLDYNDEIIKRRLAQKMAFISDEMAESLQPSKEMLEAYYVEHKEDYKKPSIYTLQQVYFNKDKRTNAIKSAKNALQSENPKEMGDNISLSFEYTDVSSIKISRDFGSAFANTLDILPVGKWVGPIRSGLGIHIVNIIDKKPAGFYTYEEVADKVNVDYNFYANKAFKEQMINSFLENYTITFELDDGELKQAIE